MIDQNLIPPAPLTGGDNNCLGQSKPLSRSRWLTGADLSDTWHEILGVHVLLLILQQVILLRLNTAIK